MILTTPTHWRAFNGQDSPNNECSTWLKAAYRSRNGVPTRGEVWFLSLFVRNGLASADQGFSTASQGSYHEHGNPCWNSPTSPFTTFFASRKPIFKTNYANCYLGYRVEWDIIYGYIYPRITTLPQDTSPSAILLPMLRQPLYSRGVHKKVNF